MPFDMMHCLLGAYLPGFLAYPQNSSNPDENWLHKFSSNMFDISVGAHSCAMNSRLKAAPTITLSEREMLRFSWIRISCRRFSTECFIEQFITTVNILPEVYLRFSSTHVLPYWR